MEERARRACVCVVRVCLCARTGRNLSGLKYAGFKFLDNTLKEAIYNRSSSTKSHLPFPGPHTAALDRGRSSNLRENGAAVAVLGVEAVAVAIELVAAQNTGPWSAVRVAF